MKLDSVIAQTAEPDVTANRLQSLLENKQVAAVFDAMDDDGQTAVVNIIGVSRFLFHFLQRHADAINEIGHAYSLSSAVTLDDVNALRIHKYRSLLRITWMDLCRDEDYGQVLSSLSHLADNILQNANKLVERDADAFESDVSKDIAIIALGKLGAGELNYSSDVDVVFVTRNSDIQTRHEMHAHYTKHIRALCRLLEENSENGFLYRVDLNLRPWGRSAPLVFSLEENEAYYEASKEAWERIAWLRGRYVAGAQHIADEMIQSMRPFVFHKTLSADDIERFISIKYDMSQQRSKAGHWNVKLGEGGIRDIEFFVHILQLVNGAHHPELQITNTLQLIQRLAKLDFISQSEQNELTASYLFLRRLENRLQMVDEMQTHQLPNNKESLKKIARHMGYQGESNDEAYANFNDDLLLNQRVASQYFERLLTKTPGLS